MEMKEYNIQRGDGRRVSFCGSKVFHIGKAALYETRGGNHVFQYAPYGNTIGLIVQQVPKGYEESLALFETHCSGQEVDALLDFLNLPSTLRIE